MGKNCPECGRKYMIDDIYCSGCGTKLVEDGEGYTQWTLFGRYNNSEAENKRRRRRSFFG